MSLLKTSINDGGTSQKVPLFLYPKNDIEYYDGPIPKFKKVIIRDSFFINGNNVIKKHLGNNINKEEEGELIVSYFLQHKTDNLECTDIRTEEEKILVFYDDYFDFFDIINVNILYDSEDCYDKELVVNALKTLSNRNEYHLEILEEDHEQCMKDEVDYEISDELIAFRKINKLLNYKHQGDKTIINKYTLELVKVIEDIAPSLHEISEYISCYSEYGNPFLPYYLIDEYYENFYYEYGDYLGDRDIITIPVEFNINGDIYNSQFIGSLTYLSDQITEHFNSIYTKWEQEQTAISSQQYQLH